MELVKVAVEPFVDHVIAGRMPIAAIRPRPMEDPNELL
jgi:hypothetical protein